METPAIRFELRAPDHCRILSGAGDARSRTTQLRDSRNFSICCLKSDPLDRALAARVRVLAMDLQASRARHLEAARTMREVMEMIKPTGHWASYWFEDGEEKGRTQGIEEGRVMLLRQQINRKFGSGPVRELFEDSGSPLDSARIDTLANAVVDCDTAEEFLARVGNGIVSE